MSSGASHFNHRGHAADKVAVQLERCPYDTTPIEAEAMSGGSLLVSCSRCGAQWEVHNAWVRRIAEPDREAVRAARQMLDAEPQA